jgi:hypothetical protein
MIGNFSVQIESFAERHFISSFKKKYKDKWDLTLTFVIQELERIDRLLLTSKAETIVDVGNIKIVKTQFRVIDTKESAKTSGNRCIVAWNIERQSVSILLVYGKTDMGSGNETTRWKSLIRENYPEYSGIF